MQETFGNLTGRLIVIAACLATAGIVYGLTATAGAETRQSDTPPPATLRLIRNATQKLSYAGQHLLLDPMLSPKGQIRSFAGIAPNPTVPLPCPLTEVLADIDGVLVSHLHPDHFDDAAQSALAKELPILCPAGDEASLSKAGFRQVTPIEKSLTWRGITITRIPGQHGSGAILARMGAVSGFVLQAPGEPTVYWVGDSVWTEDVSQAIAAFTPDIIVTHSGGATIPPYEPIIMNAEETIRTVQASGRAVVIAIHLEALDHCPVSRQTLRQRADAQGSPLPACSSRRMAKRSSSIESADSVRVQVSATCEWGEEPAPHSFMYW